MAFLISYEHDGLTLWFYVLTTGAPLIFTIQSLYQSLDMLNNTQIAQLLLDRGEGEGRTVI